MINMQLTFQDVIMWIALVLIATFVAKSLRNFSNGKMMQATATCGGNQ